ncbi:1031_t:CDS:2, partial [Paraglomus brasilianum]
MTERDKQETSTNGNGKLLDDGLIRHGRISYTGRFITSAVYYADSDALFVEFTEEPEDIADEATCYLLVGYSETGKIKFIRIDSPSMHVRGIARDKPTFSLKAAYDEKNDVFRFNLADPVPVTIQKTDTEDIELEIDDEGKLSAISILNSSTHSGYESEPDILLVLKLN